MTDMPVVLDTRVVRGSGGGPDKTILNSPRFLDRSGYRMLCAYLHPPGDPGFEQLRRKAEAWGAPLSSVADRGPLDARVVTQLLALCRRERVAIWHGHDYKTNALGLLLRRFHRMRLVTTAHGWGVADARPLYNRVDRLCLPRYERVLCVSDDIRERCLALGLPEGRCLLVENAIDTEQWSRARGVAEAKAALGMPPGRLVIGAVGRLSGEKGYDLLIRAAARLIAEGLDLELWIVGEGPERARLAALAAATGHAGRIRLPGYRADTRAIYEALDVSALSSLSEGLPNVLLEAMALGVPVVATRIAGVPKLITDEADGLLVEPGSADALADALGRVLRDPGLAGRLGRAGRRTIEARYSFAARMRRIGQIYDELLGRRAAPAPALARRSS